ncbi:MAG: M24 family metallopeptidase [Deltaproteobacteria bacterium]|nr:M24 family metallopeptidase [Deltaproteobacteria bacterium]MBW2129941.1 M24 family metallopeptidase [Deltaproteobacteria bacterium]
MDTLQPTLRNGRLIWDRINMPTDEFQSRIDVLKSKMEEENIDLVLAYGHAFDHSDNVSYLSNYVIRLPRGALVGIPRNGEPVLFFEGAPRGLPSAKTITWIEDVRPCKDVARACAAYIKEKALMPSTMGLVALHQWMPHHQLAFLLDALKDCRIVKADPIMNAMRAVKSPKECDQIRRASRAVSRVFRTITETSLPGLNERTLEATLYRAARLEGAEDVRLLLGRPQDGDWAFRPAEDLPLKTEETVILYLALVFERYWSEGIRTFLTTGNGLKIPSDMTSLESAYSQLLNAMEPRKALSECYTKALGRINEMDGYSIPGLSFAQGIGLSLKERPAFDASAAGNLDPGMAFSLHLALKDETLGTVMMGHTHLVSEHEIETLTL